MTVKKDVVDIVKEMDDVQREMVQCPKGDGTMRRNSSMGGGLC